MGLDSSESVLIQGCTSIKNPEFSNISIGYPNLVSMHDEASDTKSESKRISDKKPISIRDEARLMVLLYKILQSKKKKLLAAQKTSQTGSA